jgi:hypothetical protein
MRIEPALRDGEAPSGSGAGGGPPAVVVETSGCGCACAATVDAARFNALGGGGTCSCCVEGADGGFEDDDALPAGVLRLPRCALCGAADAIDVVETPLARRAAHDYSKKKGVRFALNHHSVPQE